MAVVAVQEEPGVVRVGPRLLITKPALSQGLAWALVKALREGSPQPITSMRGVSNSRKEIALSLYTLMKEEKGIVRILAKPDTVNGVGYTTDDFTKKIDIVYGWEVKWLDGNIAVVKTARCYSRRVGCFKTYVSTIYDPDNDRYYTYFLTREPRDPVDLQGLLGGPRVAAALKKGLEVKRQGDIYFIRRGSCRGELRGEKAVVFSSHVITGRVYVDANTDRIYVEDGVAAHPQHPPVELRGCWEVAWNTRRVKASIRVNGVEVRVEPWSGVAFD